MLGELTEMETAEILKKNSVGRLGCTDGAHVYIVPMNYRYESDHILCYSLEGLKIDMMRRHPSVCFEVEEFIDSNNWKCVIINGTFEEIIREEELAQLRPGYTEYILRKKVSLNHSAEVVEIDRSSEIAADAKQVFYKINLSRVSGRFQKGM